MFGGNNRSFTSPSITTTSTSLFGSPQPNNVFNNDMNKTIIGSTAFNGATFGGTNNNSSFGSSNTNAFGTNNNSFGSGSVFGGNNTTQNNNVFGGSNNGGSIFGSKVSKGTNQYNDSSSTGLGRNPSSNYKGKVDCTFIKHHIYFMNQYEKKPIALLRSEDYEINKSNRTMGGMCNNVSGGSLFGNPTNNPSTFGNTGVGGLFGGNTNSNTGNTGGLFGNNNSTPFGGTGSGIGGIGTGGLFGNNNASTNNTVGGGLFGNANNPTGGAFGGGGGIFGGNNNSGFGSNNNNNVLGGGLFGQNNNNSLNTGIGNSGGGLFGNSNNNNNNLFGGGGGIFGGNNNANKPASGGLFGNNNNPTNTGGGGLFGGNTNSGLGGIGTGGGLFGNNNSSNTGGSLFGNNNSNTPTTGGLFGGGNNTFGNTRGGLFGNNNNTLGGGGGGGLFGGNANAGNTGGGLFGNNTSNTGRGGLFGSNNNNSGIGGGGGGLFGNNKPAAGGGGLFGNTNANANTGGGLFGNNNNTNTLGGGGLFGSNTNTNTGGGLFGNNNNSSTGLGGGGLFGNNNVNKPVGGGLFGSSSTTPNTGLGGGGLFGGNTNTNTGGAGGLFGNTNSTLGGGGGGLFGNNNNTGLGSGGGLFGSNNNNNNNIQFNSQFTEQIVDSCKKEPYTQGEFGLVKIGQQIDHCAQAAGVSNTATVENTSLSTKPNTIALPPLPSHSAILSKSLFSQKKTDCVIAPPSIISRCSKIKQLIITQPVNDDEDEQNDNHSDDVIPVINSPHISPIKPDESDYYKTLSDTELSKEENDDDNTTDERDSENDSDDNDYSQNESESENDSVKRSNPISPVVKAKHHKSNSGSESNTDNESSTTATASANSSENEGDDEDNNEEDDENDLLPKCSKEDYIIFPSINSLKSKSQSQLSSVKDFSICHKNIGGVIWLGKTDVRNLNIDESVIIDLDENNRPYVEVKSEKAPTLNKTAIIMLYQIKRPDNVDLQDFKSKLIKRAKKMDATHLDYDDKSCQWRFQVEHFSRYGFMEEDEDSDNEDANKNKNTTNTNVTATSASTATTSSVHPFFTSNNSIIPMIPHPKPKSTTTIKFHQNIFQQKQSLSMEEEEEEEEDKENRRNNNNYNKREVNQSSNIAFSNRPQLPKIEFNRLPMKQSPCFSLLKEVVGEEINSDSVHAFSVYCKDRSRPAYLSFNNKIISIGTKDFSLINCYEIPQTQSLVNYDEMKLILHSLLNITEISNDDDNNDDSNSGSSSDSEEEMSNNNNDNIYHKPFRFGPISNVYDFLSDYSSPLSSSLSSQSYPKVVSAMFSLLLSLYLPRESRNEIPNYIHEIQPNSTVSKNVNEGDSDDDDYDYEYNNDNEKWQTLLYRRERITEWLISIVSNLSLPIPINVYQKILYHLLENDIEKATNEAFNNNDFNLALLISQLNGDITSRGINNGNSSRGNEMQLQLECFKKYKIVNKMNKDLLNIYYILAGEIQLIQLPSNISKLPWICYVALYYWYGNRSCGNLLLSLQLFKKYNEYLIHPYPLFYNINNNNSSNNSNKKRKDILYHLLWYYADESYDICHLLDNCSISTNSHDYFFTWILYYIIISINNNNVSESDLKNQVYVNNSLVEQLEANGLWEWAIYVGRFNENKETRSVVCREILERNIPERINQKYKSIKQFLDENKIISPEEIKDAEKMRLF